MTYAPRTLLDARKVIQRYTGLPNVAVGITGDEDHDGGYHQGWDNRRLVNGSLRDYSWQESPRDWNHKTDAASAIDVGWFTKLLDGRPISLIDFNLWLVDQCSRNAPDTKDIREIIYTPDGKTVKRWDRLKKRSSGDPSHTRHTHISRFRDAQNNPIAPLFERFFKSSGTTSSGRGSKNMFLLKVAGDDNPEVYISDGLNTRSVPGGHWDQTCVPLINAGVPFITNYPSLESLLQAGGPMVTEDTPVSLTDAHLETIASKVAARLTRLQFTAQQ